MGTSGYQWYLSKQWKDFLQAPIVLVSISYLRCIYFCSADGGSQSIAHARQTLNHCTPLEALTYLGTSFHLFCYWLWDSLYIHRYSGTYYVDQLAWNSLRSACLSFLRSWIKRVCHHACPFKMFVWFYLF